MTELTQYKLIIKELVWTINFVPPNHEKLILDGGRLLGATRYANTEIHIANNLSTPIRDRVLIHELTHAYITTYLVSEQESFTEEEVCDFVAQYGYEIIKAKEEILDGIRKNLL